jgi:hypothetical protein
MSAPILALESLDAALAGVITISGISLVALTLSAITVIVVMPAVWSQDRDRRHAARAVLRDILHAINGHSCKRLL